MNKELSQDALRCALKWAPSMNGLSAEGVLINRLQAAIDAPGQDCEASIQAFFDGESGEDFASGGDSLGQLMWLYGRKLRPVAAIEAVEQVPVYQYQMANGHWIDQDKDSYEYNLKLGQATIRMMYAKPKPVADLTDDEIEDVWAGMSDPNTDEIDMVAFGRAVLEAQKAKI